MLIGEFRHLTSAGSTLQESLFDQERFVDLLNRSGIFAQCSGNSRKPHGTTLKFINNSTENLVVYLIQSVFIDI